MFTAQDARYGVARSPRLVEKSRRSARLDYAEWLRRQRRINDAKPVLVAALEVFRRLRAAPWTQRAEAELRARGVSDTVASTSRDSSICSLDTMIFIRLRPLPDHH